MKYLTASALLAGAATAANDAYLWTIDAGGVTPGSLNQVSSVPCFTAERVLARRKGVTDSAHGKVLDDGVLADLNRFGGWQQPLFGAGSTQRPAKVFISISGYDGGKLENTRYFSKSADQIVEVSDFNTLPDMWVEEPEATLLDIFEAKTASDDVCEYTIKVPTKKSVGIRYIYSEEVRFSIICSGILANISQNKACLPQSEIEYLPAIMAITATVPTPDTIGGRGIASFHRTLLHLSATENIESTLIVLPKAGKLKKPTKSELKKRLETPLDLPTMESQPSIFKSNHSSKSNFTLPKTIPQYFQSKDSCDNTTNSCMGHGSCVKAHSNLFHCKCNSTVVRKNEDGTTKSVQWGGNACQKKDVSTEFILFALFGIFFTTVVVGSIGLLYTMGAQDLPSVIGAGVVGPRAQR